MGKAHCLSWVLPNRLKAVGQACTMLWYCIKSHSLTFTLTRVIIPTWSRLCWPLSLGLPWPRVWRDSMHFANTFSQELKNKETTLCQLPGVDFMGISPRPKQYLPYRSCSKNPWVCNNNGKQKLFTIWWSYVWLVVVLYNLLFINLCTNS